MVNYVIRIETEKDWFFILKKFKNKGNNYWIKRDYKSHFYVRADVGIGIEIKDNKIESWCQYQWYVDNTRFDGYTFITINNLMKPKIIELW